MVQPNNVTCEAVSQYRQNVSSEITVICGPSFGDDSMHHACDLEDVVCQFLIRLQAASTVQSVYSCECLTNWMTILVTQCIHAIVAVHELIAVCNLIQPVEIRIERHLLVLFDHRIIVPTIIRSEESQCRTTLSSVCQPFACCETHQQIVYRRTVVLQHEVNCVLRILEAVGNILQNDIPHIDIERNLGTNLDVVRIDETAFSDILDERF